MKFLALNAGVVIVAPAAKLLVCDPVLFKRLRVCYTAKKCA